MAIPLVWMIIFLYVPMYGVVVAFKNFSVLKGIGGSPWVGFREFERLFGSYQFWNIVRNTFQIAFVKIIFAFPAPILLAIALNEMRIRRLRKTIQTITFAPYFISTVVMAGMILTFLDPRIGFVGFFFKLFNAEAVSLIAKPGYFAYIYAFTEIWQHAGFLAVIYLAALSTVDRELYDAARIDGVSRMQKIVQIDFPSIRSTIIILLILDIGHVMTLGFEKVYLLQNPLSLSSSEIIATLSRFGLRRSCTHFL
jgi:putative aldouronate transport system permease protein